jgi:hypothetical protein
VSGPLTMGIIEVRQIHGIHGSAARRHSTIVGLQVGKFKTLGEWNCSLHVMV